MNSENSKTSDSHRLLLNLLDKIKVKRRDKYVNQIKSYKITHLKYQLRQGMKSLSYLMDHKNTFKTKTGSYLELLMTETMKLLGSTKSKTNKDENGENVPHLEISEVILVHCNIVNNDYLQDSRVLYTFAPSKSIGQLLDISKKKKLYS